MADDTTREGVSPDEESSVTREDQTAAGDGQTDATPSDAQAADADAGVEGGEAEAQQAEAPKHPTRSMIDDLAKRRAQQVAESNPSTGDDDDAGEQGDGVADGGADGGQASEDGKGEGDKPADADKPANVAEIDPDALVAIKVNGQTVYKKFSEVSAASQRAYAADQRFREAADIRRRNEELERENEALKGGAAQSGGDKTSQKEGAAPAVDFKDLAQKILEGDEQEVAAALEAALTQREAAKGDDESTLTPEQIADQAAQRASQMIAEQQRMQHDIETVQREFSDVFSHPEAEQAATVAALRERYSDLVSIGYPADELRNLDVQQLNRQHRYEQSRGAVRGDLDIYRAGCAHARTTVLKTTSGAQTASSPTLSERREAKRNQPDQPKTASGRRPAPQAPAPKSRGSVVADIKRARGQA